MKTEMVIGIKRKKRQPAQTVNSAKVEKLWDKDHSRWKEEYSQKPGLGP